MELTTTGRAGVYAVEAAGVSAAYGAEVVVESVDLSIGTGEIVGVIGPNGAGKTSLLRILSGTLPVSAGAVRIGGRELRTFGRRELARLVAFVPPSIRMPVACTVGEFVALGRTPYVWGWSRLSRSDKTVVLKAMNDTDVLSLAERMMDELSAGEKQRVIVAMALAQEPRILLLDEPTAHLDIQHAWGLMELVCELNRQQGITVVLSLHDLNLAAEFCSHLLLLDRGRTAAWGTAEEVLKPDLVSKVYAHPLEVLRVGEDQAMVIHPQRSRRS